MVEINRSNNNNQHANQVSRKLGQVHRAGVGISPEGKRAIPCSGGGYFGRC
jgi:hypothetical protein